MLARFTTVVALSLCLGSCASIIHGTTDTITVNSLDPQATIYVDGAARGVGVAQIDVKRGKKHAIWAVKDGHQSSIVETGESFDPTTLLGILIDFGIITIPIDLISGAAWRVEPTTYTVTPVVHEQARTEQAEAEPSHIN